MFVIMQNFNNLSSFLDFCPHSSNGGFTEKDGCFASVYFLSRQTFIGGQNVQQFLAFISARPAKQ